MVLGVPVGSGRDERLDPLALPVRFTASDVGADERVRDVELTRDRVVLRRAVRGIRMAVNLPVTAFLGVALRLVPGSGDAGELAIVSLEHRDAALSIPLFCAPYSDGAVRNWHLWGDVLRLPLLLADFDGTVRKPFSRLGIAGLAGASPRRRRKNAIKARRPTMMLRRSPATLPPQPVVHRDEREIIARD
jgi:hypothetical protein